MKCLPYLIAILACLGVLMISLLMAVIIKHRKEIKKWWKKYNIKKFLVSVFFPALIPLIISVVTVIAENGKNDFIDVITDPMLYFLIAMCVVSLIVFVFQYKDWKKDHEDRKTEWVNGIYREAYDKLYDVLKAKTTAYRTKALTSGHGFLKDSDIGYDVFDHIRTICRAYRLAISEITNIPTTHITISFIYHYTYDSANYKDKAWRWIIGKDSNFNIPLGDFIARDETLYHHMIHNNIDGVFFNDKRDAANECKYYFSSKDNLHEHQGSIMASRFSFSSNSQGCCEGILMITTYGDKFIRDNSEFEPAEFREIIEHDIFPCYKNLIKIELGKLYFRHKTEKVPCRFEKALKILTEKRK